jgi:uncharacterized protein YuzB (UPF0349 family)
MKPVISRRAAIQAIVVAAVAAFAAGCANTPDVWQDQDPAVDLHAYKTFAFYDAPAERGYASLVGQHLKQATREQLERQHYVYSEQNPDLRVAMFLLLAKHQELRSTPGRGPYGYRGWNSGIETVSVREGSLRIDLVDAKKNALVWQGVAEGRVDAKALQNPGPALREAVAEIFARYGEPRR